MNLSDAINLARESLEDIFNNVEIHHVKGSLSNNKEYIIDIKFSDDNSVGNEKSAIISVDFNSGEVSSIETK